MDGTVVANGVTIHYLDDGAGPPIVLLHGGLMEGTSGWGAHLPSLTDGHRVLVPDSRGHGRSDNPTGELSYELMADDVAAFIAALGLERPLVVGFSDGGITALQLALRHPGTAGGLVLGGIVSEPDEAYWRFVHELGVTDSGFDEDAFARAAGDFHTYVSGLHGDRWPVLLQETARLWYSLPTVTPEQLATVDVPAVVLTGDRDEPSMNQAPRIAAALPRGEVAVIPGADHGGAVTSPLFADIVRDAAERFGMPAESVFRQVEGRELGGSVSVLVTTIRVAGGGPKLHRHPYDETFVIRAGAATFVVDGVESVGRGGDVLVVGAGKAHKFANTGGGTLDMVNIHAAPVVVTEWLE